MNKFRYIFPGFFLLFFLSLNGFSQEKIFTVNSGEILKKGIAYHDDQKYKAAINEYKKIPENDTNYVLALYELSLSARVDSQYALSEETAKKALLSSPGEYEHDLLIQLGSVYDEDEKLDSGNVYFSKAISRFPNSSQAWHAKGINLYLKKQYDSAYHYFEKAVLMNPYAFNSHYFLGLIAMEKGYPIQAMMSFGLSLMISPGGTRASQCLQKLFQIANLSDKVLENLNDRKEETYFKEDYSEIETYFKSKIALEKKYEIQSKLDEGLFRQFNLVCEKLPDHPQHNDDLWATYYAPIYKELFVKKYFGTATIIMVSGLENEGVKKLIKDNKKDLEAAGDMITVRLNEIGYYRSADKTTYKDVAGYLFEDNRPVAKGKLINGDKKNLNGEWTYYNKIGDVTKVINFKNGKYEGAYKSFNFDGVLNSEGNFSNDKLNGEFREYHTNGLLKLSGTMNNGIKEKTYKEFYQNGSLSLLENYKNGKREGPATVYYSSGSKQYEANYQEDLLEGIVKEYYTNGRLFSTTNLKKGKAEGEKIVYYINGSVQSKGEMHDGDKEGLTTSFFPDGKISAKELYRKGKLDGVSISYHENGNEKVTITYDMGDQEGACTEKDEEGRVTVYDEYKKGHLKKLTYYNILTNKVVKENIIDDKEKNILSVYNTTGNLTKEAICNRDGIYNGECKDFYINGKVSMLKNFVKGNANGKATEYFSDGKIEIEEYYKDDTPDSLYRSYFSNGKIEKEGMYVNGNKQGYWYTYDNLGTLINKDYYLDDFRHGVNITYSPNGKISSEIYWDHGMEIRSVEYDSSKKVIAVQVFKPGEKTSFNHYNFIGIKQRSGTVSNNFLQGIDTEYFPDGKIESLSFYRNGLLDSTMTMYFSNGKKFKEGQYVNDEYDGTWKTYDRYGKLSAIEHYTYGEANGIDSFFSEENTLETTIPYKDNTRHGWAEKYSPGKELIYKYHYINGLIVGYTYQLPDGSLIKEIPVENSAKMETLKTYYKNGKVASETGYQNGDYEGARKIYYPDGKLYYEVTFLNAVRDGDEKEYHHGGQLNYIRHYINGEMDGAVKKYNEKGILIEEETYYKGYKHGTSKYYDETGKILQTITYYWGELVRIQ